MDEARRGRRLPLVIVAGLLALVTAGCSLATDVGVLSSDRLGGRDNATPGSALTQAYLLARLRTVGAVGLDPTRPGDAGFRQAFAGGTNLLGLIRGRELPDEYVIVGAHFDHLGSRCRTQVPTDTICNGATDDAAGVAALLGVAQSIRHRLGTPRRSVILALWDREEDGLLGSQYYVQHPLVPLAQTVGYVNFDIQGANLLPSLRATSFAIGAETGGAALTDSVGRAIGGGWLRTRLVSQIFGQGRSDYANFIGARVPTVFFSDSTGPCYHTAQDEVRVVDFTKLRAQTGIAYRVTADLAQRPDRLPFVGDAPLATFADALALQQVAAAAITDLARFGPDDQAKLLAFRDAVDAIVAAGPGAFGPADVPVLLGGAANAVEILSTGTCDGFLRR
jgi:hypothetical protein